MKKKILIISEYNIYTSIGGTEYYIDMLIKGLLKSSYEVLLITKGLQHNKIQTALKTTENFGYKIIFLPTRRFKKQEIQQSIISSTWYEILPVLEKEKPDIIHVHTYSTFFNIRHFEACAQRFKNVFFTSHIPGHFCPKGDLIKFNREPCDGIIYARCALCLFSDSIKTGVSNLVFHYHQKVLERLKSLNKLGIKLIGVSEWQRNNFISNGFNPAQIAVIRQAVHNQTDENGPRVTADKMFRVGYLGRLSKEKGSVFLFKVIEKLILTSKFTFVLGIPKNNSDAADMESLDKLLQHGEGRIKIMDGINNSNKSLFFNEIDCLFIPSFCIETGPVVLLEAVQYGKHVLGPDTGGPLEFSYEFPQLVLTYTWNNQPDAVNKIKTLGENKKGAEDYNPTIKKMEESFIQKHLEIYNSSSTA